MAEILGAVASGISVAQITFQFIGFGHKLQQLRDVPDELQNIVTDLKILKALVSPLVLSLEQSGKVEASSKPLLDSLIHCDAVASSLYSLVSKLNQHSNGSMVKRSFGLIDAALRKDEVRTMQTRLESSTSLVLMAMMMNMQSQQASLAEASKVTSINIAHMNQLLEKTSLVEEKRVEDQNQPLVSIDNVQNCSITEIRPRKHHNRWSTQCYCTCHLSSKAGVFWPVGLPLWSKCSRPGCCRHKSHTLRLSLAQLGIMTVIQINLNTTSSARKFNISPSLSFERMVKRTSPGFQVLWRLQTGQEDDWPKARNELIRLFETGQASPVDIDPDGETWLEKTLHAPWLGKRNDIQFELLEFLVKMGTQLNTSRLMYKTVKWIGEGPHLLLQKEIVRGGFDASEVEAPSFSKWPRPCSPDWSSEALTPDPFYIDWISTNIEISPGFAGFNPLLEAILIGSREEVSKCLTSIYITDKTNLLGQSPLHLAVHRPQHLHAVLNAGAEVTTCDRHGITPLMYAAAIGNTDATILLLESGANPCTRDKLWRRHFMDYAVARGHWETVMGAANHICSSTKFTDEDAWIWLSWALVLWATDRGLWTREPTTLQTLLNWGAPPNITFGSDPDTNDDTVLHHIRKLDELEILVGSGFNKFNHPNSRGVYPLSAIAKYSNPDLLRICLKSGSLVNQQDRSGHSVLHLTSRWLQCRLPNPRNDSGVHSLWVDDECEKRTKNLECIILLLENGADPVLGDHCLCACSRSGCNPSTAIMKHSLWDYLTGSKRQTNVWSLEWLSTVNQYRGYEVAKQCLLDLIRWIKFEELELTHTCHCEHNDRLSILLRRKPVDQDDLNEIRDEEKIIIGELEQEMQELAGLEIEGLEDFWIQTLSHFDHIQKTRFREEWSKKPRNDQTQESCEPLHNYLDNYIDHKNDQFVANAVIRSYYPESPECYDLGVDRYLYWLDHHNRTSSDPKSRMDVWYNKRRGWIKKMVELTSLNPFLELQKA